MSKNTVLTQPGTYVEERFENSETCKAIFESSEFLESDIKKEIIKILKNIESIKQKELTKAYKKLGGNFNPTKFCIIEMCLDNIIDECIKRLISKVISDFNDTRNLAEITIFVELIKGE